MDIPNILNKIILESVTFCYPCKNTERVKPENMGIFKPYYNVPLTKEQVDNLIYPWRAPPQNRQQRGGTIRGAVSEMWLR
jgi:hypothetical protein